MKKSTFILLLFFAIVKLQAQEYLITFAGTGASTKVDTVKIENLTQGDKLTLSGTDILRFNTTSTEINPTFNSFGKTLSIYPNPTNGNSTVEFVTKVSGLTNFELYDHTGKRLSSNHYFLEQGMHSFEISGLSNGMYIVKVSSQADAFSGKLVSSNASNSGLKIIYTGDSQNVGNVSQLKNAITEKLFTYNVGDRLKIIGISGNYSTIITDIPTQSKTFTFTFVACTDADGNNYPVVQIGTQTWMAENLKTTKYSDGLVIPNVTDNDSWNKLTTGAYCWYGNDASLKKTYGALYNWHAVNTNKLAPVGWHVPTDTEWTALTNYLGGDITAGSKIKETGTTHWKSPNASNETGFTALPCGYRENTGTFQNIGSFGYWWSSSLASSLSAWYRLAYYSNSNIGRYYSNKGGGLAIRCLKD